MMQVMSTAFLTNPFFCTVFTVRQTIQYSSKLLKSGCILCHVLSLDQLRNHGFENTQRKRSLLAGRFYQMKAEGNFLLIEYPFQILRKKVCETMSPIDNELSKMHKTNNHVFSDSVLCLGKSTMTTPEIKFTERWKEHIQKDITMIIGGEPIQFTFLILLGANTNDITLRIDEWSRQSQGGEDGHGFTPETYPRRVTLMGMMNSPGTSCKFVQVQRIGSLKKYTDTTGGKWDELAKTSHGCISCTTTSSPKRMQKLPTRRNEARWQKHDFNAGAASQKMIMELISSAHDFCMLYSISDNLGQSSTILKVTKIRLQLFSLQGSRKLPVCLEHLLQTNAQIMLG